MSPLRSVPGNRRNGRRSSPDSLRKGPLTPVRKSARLQEKDRIYAEVDTLEKPVHIPSPTSLTPVREIYPSATTPTKSDRKRKRGEEEPAPDRTPQITAPTHTPDSSGRKRKRSEEPRPDQTPQDNELPPPPGQGLSTPPSKRQRPSSDQIAVTSDPTSLTDDGTKNINPIERWIQEGIWSGMNANQETTATQPPTRKRSIATSSSKNESGDGGTSGQSLKNFVVASRRYEILLLVAGIHMDEEDEVEITTESREMCQTLLDADQTVPQDSLFNDDLYKKVCKRIRNKIEARIVRDLLPLIVPSAEILELRGATHLKHLIETVNEMWLKSIPLVNGPRPQPDYSVGLRTSAFTAEQARKLQPAFGDLGSTSLLIATDEMYFPFLTTEVKCGNQALLIADRQNAHSAAVAAKAVVELYRMVGRGRELHLEILTFSVSHDHDTVRLWGHYPVITDEGAHFYRHSIDTINLTRHEGKERWIPYKFTKNVYEKFYPIHLKRLCSAIDQLPDPKDLAVPALSELSDFISENPEPATPSAHEPDVELQGSAFKRPMLPPRQ